MGCHHCCGHHRRHRYCPHCGAYLGERWYPRPYVAPWYHQPWYYQPSITPCPPPTYYSAGTAAANQAKDALG